MCTHSRSHRHTNTCPRMNTTSQAHRHESIHMFHAHLATGTLHMNTRFQGHRHVLVSTLMFPHMWSCTCTYTHTHMITETRHKYTEGHMPLTCGHRHTSQIQPHTCSETPRVHIHALIVIHGHMYTHMITDVINPTTPRVRLRPRTLTFGHRRRGHTHTDTHRG